MKKELIYFDTYVLQKDLRIRLPKNILANINIEKNNTVFDIYLDNENKEIILKPNFKNSEKEKINGKYKDK